MTAMEPAGKTALITGSSRRIGACIASALAAAGANLVIHSRRENPEAEELAERCRRMGIRAETVRQDFTDTRGTEAWFGNLQSDFGPVDILVNSASSYQRRGYHELNEEHLRHSSAIHLLAPLMMMRAMAAGERPASVVNILDTRITSRDPHHADYHLAKRALFTATRDLALEYAPRMRINAVAPGIILPPPGGKPWVARTHGRHKPPENPWMPGGYRPGRTLSHPVPLYHRRNHLRRRRKAPQRRSLCPVNTSMRFTSGI